ncbi:hypothetical protein [Saccharopolyspora elongata]|uniref:PE domain-containing protein n=1 Tax=Saccharopolyspora elongata TaxID=2530387 RepID=A0A4R4YV38_9PSEU|nr:hypothetical protein [Saccharopolyspora elongata]TDD49186.1 hypothetical protein E1288_20020 [Saccharopolyspora elongata]
MTGSIGSAAAGLAATNDAMQGIISAANSGGFQVTPEAGDELIRVFREFQDAALLDIQRELSNLKYRTPLGDSPAGQAIADFNEQVVAGGDGRSYEELILQMKERVPQVIEAIKKGIQSYREVDEGNAGNVGVRD